MVNVIYDISIAVLCDISGFNQAVKHYNNID